MHEREKTCCFTGHRPRRLPWGVDEWDARCLRARELLRQQVELAYGRGYRHFICGMAEGADLLFCEVVLQTKQTHEDLVLEAAIPHPGQAEKWSARQQERYRRLLAQCDIETTVCQSYTHDCMMRRNYYMVERSGLLIALYDGQGGGGTARTLIYALREGLEIAQIDPTEI
ncbi:MAG: DUF1273 family protein [Oscillospiraceae bacterium]|nr:DUF1273 family protein [Oscillospiraceae bacterium]